jgi:hypothetical protein
MFRERRRIKLQGVFMIHSVSKVGRIVAVALVAGGLAVSALPAQAASIGFGINIGGGGGGGISIGGGGGGISFHIGGGGCWSVDQVRRALREDFRDLDFKGRDGNRVRFTGESRDDGEDYRITVNRCTGDVRLREL